MKRKGNANQSDNGRQATIPVLDDDYTEDLSQPAPLPTGTPWGRITEVLPDDVLGVRHGKDEWDLLFTEVMLRLEKTPLPKLLQIPFASETLRNNAASALKDRVALNYLGKRDSHDVARFVEIISRKNSNGYYLFIRRGEDWRSLD